MTKDDIARMARESGGLPDPMVFIGAYERFANLVAAAQWERTSASFDEWWDGDVMPSANPFVEGTAAYWAWAGWQAAQPEPLTDGEIYTAYITAANQTLRPQDERIAFAFARAIEAAHGIKEGT